MFFPLCANWFSWKNGNATRHESWVHASNECCIFLFFFFFWNTNSIKYFISFVCCLISLKHFPFQHEWIANRISLAFPNARKQCNTLAFRFTLFRVLFLLSHNHKQNQRTMYRIQWIFFECFFHIRNKFNHHSPREGEGYFETLKGDPIEKLKLFAWNVIFI